MNEIIPGMFSADFDLVKFLVSLPVTALALVALLAVTFAVAVKQRRHVVMDVAWGLGFVTVACVSFALSAGVGDPIRRLVLVALVVAWGLRLAGYLAWRMRDGHEDPRYEAMLAKAPGGDRNRYALKRVYLTQAIVLLLVSLVVQVGMFASGALNWLGWIGVAVWVIGFFFETVGDWQLARHKANPAKRGTILDTGVWAWTRHPNYFGDAACWWGVFLVTASSWPGMLTIFAPALMTWALVAKTGKALTESRMVNRPGYRDYIARTSGFFPLPPRRTPGTLR